MLLSDVKFEDIAYFYDNYYIGDEDLKTLIAIVEGGSSEEALDKFIDEYIMNPIDKYQDLVYKYLGFTLAGEVDGKDKTKITSDVATLTFGLSALLAYNYKRYNKIVETPMAYKEAGVTWPGVKRDIYNANIAKYQEAIDTAMTRTQSMIINAVKSIQKDYSVFNTMSSRQGLEGQELSKAIRNFKTLMMERYKDIFELQNTKKMVPILSKDGKLKNYKIDYYIDMVTRNTIVGMSRDANEASARVNGERVVEYLQVDSRAVKHDRKICQRILGIKILGKSLLALDPVTATALGIMTVDEAKTTPDFAMSINCRHSVKRLDKRFLRQIDKLVEAAA